MFFGEKTFSKIIYLIFYLFCAYYITWNINKNPLWIVIFTAGTAPDFVKKPDSCTAPLKGDAKFEATLSGEPYPDVKWYAKYYIQDTDFSTADITIYVT